MNVKPWKIWSFTFATLCGIQTLAAAAPGSLPMSSHQASDQRPDVFAMIPLVGNVSRSFFVGDGYKVKLGTKDMRIDHMGTHSHSTMKQRTCMLGLDYSTPVAGFFTSSFELPILNSPDLALADWSRSSLGDYVARFSRGADTPPSLQLVFSARF